MLYTHDQLKQLEDDKQHRTAVGRYLHKFHNHRKEIKSLKFHEKDFFFSHLSNLRNGQGELAFDLYSIQEANNYLFFKLLLTYFHHLDFLPPIQGPYGLITSEQILKDKQKIFELLGKWEEKLFSNRGAYIPEIFKEFNRKVKLLEGQKKNNLMGSFLFQSRVNQLKLTSFHIYYTVVYFFDEKGKSYITFQVLGETWVINVYSYVHILSRHYMPGVNSFDVGRSFNENLPIVDVKKLPYSIRNIILQYLSVKARISKNDEYLIFTYNSVAYILWFNYRRMDELNKSYGFHIRSMYKIEAQRDFDKMHGLTKVDCDANLSFFI